MEEASQRRIPVLVVSGFLGSGKTTLVRRLLDAAQAAGDKVAFVSNELGELGVDEALLGGGEEAFVELAGGCVCCALNDELFDTLNAIRERVDPDRIVIETSGVAIPHDVQIVLYGPPIRDWVSEEAVVTVVDADRLSRDEDVDQTFTEQLESADLVVLHKVDLLEGEPPAVAALVARLSARIEAWNPGVAVVPASFGEVDPRLLLAAPVRDPATVEHHAHDHAAHAHLHEAYETEAVEPPAGTVAELEAWVLGLKALRVKGFVEREGRTWAVQGVGRRAEVVAHDGPVSEGLIGRVVVIRRRPAAA